MASSVRESYSREAAVGLKSARKSKEEVTRVTENEIKDNPFYKIIGSTEYSDEQKAELVAKVLTFDEKMTEDENRSRLDLLRQLDAYLQFQRTQHAEEMIRLSKSDVYPKLKTTLDDILTQYQQFEQSLTALTGPLEAIQRIRAEGQAFDSIMSAHELRQHEDALRAAAEDVQVKVDNLTGSLDRLQDDHAYENSRWFKKTFSPKHRAKLRQMAEDITTKTADLTTTSTELQTATGKYEEVKSQVAADPRQQQLRQLIDIGSEKYAGKIDALADAAQGFIDYTRDSLTTSLMRLEKAGEDIEALDRKTRGQHRAYTVLAEGSVDAHADNQKKLVEVEGKIEELKASNADPVALTELKETQAQLQDYIATQNNQNSSMAQLNIILLEQEATLEAMGKSNTNAMARADQALNKGVATAATRLATVLVTIHTAAADEAVVQVNDVFDAVKKKTQSLLSAQFENIVAMWDRRNQEMVSTITTAEQLEQMLTGMQGDMIGSIKDAYHLVNEAGQAAKTLGDKVEDYRGVEATATSEAASEVVDGAKAPEAAKKRDAKFGIEI
jgi:hypothetical protein